MKLLRFFTDRLDLSFESNAYALSSLIVSFLLVCLVYYSGGFSKSIYLTSFLGFICGSLGPIIVYRLGRWTNLL